MSVSDRDLRAMMRLVIEAGLDVGDCGELLPWAVLEGLMALVACDAVSLFILDSGRGCGGPSQDLPADPCGADSDTAAEWDAVFFRHYWDSSPCSYFDRTGDLDSVIRTSDFYTRAQLRANALWAEYTAPLGFERELVACLAGRPGRTLRLVFWRGPGRDFSERDRAAVWLLRPHLLRLYRQRRAAGPGPADLTPRQLELLTLVAQGHTNRQIARHLGFSESTARKHLEHIFQRLNVHSRAAAVSRAFPYADLSPDGAANRVHDGRCRRY